MRRRTDDGGGVCVELAETARRSKGEAIFCEKPIDSNDQRLMTQPHNKPHCLKQMELHVTLLETVSTTYLTRVVSLSPFRCN